MVHPLQTNEWANFRKEWGNEVLNTNLGVITLHKIPLTKYKIGVFEKGPKPTDETVKELIDLGKGKNIIFIKLEPNIEKVTVNEDNLSLLFKHSIKGRRLFTPTTFWIDLTKSEDDLLKSFHSKTRYNIRLAQKQGVVVKEDNSNEAFERYLELTKETSKRQGFYAHTEKYHRLMWKHLHTEMKKPIAHLLTATYQGEIITTWVVFNYDGFLYYPYGASTERHKNVMANNLMMWEAIRFGKKMKLHTFDLWGREEGKGFTKFKEGYNPKVVEFLGTYDLIINKPLYYIYRIIEEIRWKLLRLKAKILS